MQTSPPCHDMGSEDETDFSEAVVTCEGNLHDPDFSTKFQLIVDKLKSLLYKSKKEEVFKVRKIEPWNSVRVTISIPKEAAQRLRVLAQQGNQVLRQLGILSVQVEGDQVISLTLAGKNNEPQELILSQSNCGQSTSTSANSLSIPSASAFLSSLVPNSHSQANRQNQASTSSQPSQHGFYNHHHQQSTTGSAASATQSSAPGASPFVSPNVVAPSGESIPSLPSTGAAPTPRPLHGGPFSFSSMTHAVHTLQRSDSLTLSTSSAGGKSPILSSSPSLSSYNSVQSAGPSSNNLIRSTNRAPPMLQGISQTSLLTPQTRSDQTRFIYNSNSGIVNSVNANSNLNLVSSGPSSSLSSSSSPSSSSLASSSSLTPTSSQSLQIQFVEAPVPPPPYTQYQQQPSSQFTLPQGQAQTQGQFQPSSSTCSTVVATNVVVPNDNKPITSPLLVNLLQYGDGGSPTSPAPPSTPRPQQVTPPAPSGGSSTTADDERTSMPPPPLSISLSLENPKVKRYQLLQQQRKMKRGLSADMGSPLSPAGDMSPIPHPSPSASPMPSPSPSMGNEGQSTFNQSSDSQVPNNINPGVSLALTPGPHGQGQGLVQGQVRQMTLYQQGGNFRIVNPAQISGQQLQYQGQSQVQGQVNTFSQSQLPAQFQQQQSQNQMFQQQQQHRIEFQQGGQTVLVNGPGPAVGTIQQQQRYQFFQSQDNTRTNIGQGQGQSYAVQIQRPLTPQMQGMSPQVQQQQQAGIQQQVYTQHQQHSMYQRQVMYQQQQNVIVQGQQQQHLNQQHSASAQQQHLNQPNSASAQQHHQNQLVQMQELQQMKRQEMSQSLGIQAQHQQHQQLFSQQNHQFMQQNIQNSQAVPGQPQNTNIQFLIQNQQIQAQHAQFQGQSTQQQLSSQGQQNPGVSLQNRQLVIQNHQRAQLVLQNSQLTMGGQGQGQIAQNQILIQNQQLQQAQVQPQNTSTQAQQSFMLQQIQQQQLLQQQNAQHQQQQQQQNQTLNRCLTPNQGQVPGQFRNFAPTTRTPGSTSTETVQQSAQAPPPVPSSVTTIPTPVSTTVAPVSVPVPVTVVTKPATPTSATFVTPSVPPPRLISTMYRAILSSQSQSDDPKVPASQHGGKRIRKASKPFSTGGKPRVLLNPLTGHLEPIPGERSSSESEEDEEEGGRKGKGKGSRGKSISRVMASKDTASPSPTGGKVLSAQGKPVAAQGKPVTSIGKPGSFDSRIRNIGANPSTQAQASLVPAIPTTSTPSTTESTAIGEKIKLRLKLEKNEPAYKVDVAFIKKAEKNSSFSGIPVSEQSSSSEQGTGAVVEQPRVPPLHISLRGKNSAVVVSPRRDEPGGGSTPTYNPNIPPPPLTPKPGLSYPLVSTNSDFGSLLPLGQQSSTVEQSLNFKPAKSKKSSKTARPKSQSSNLPPPLPIPFLIPGKNKSRSKGQDSKPPHLEPQGEILRSHSVTPVPESPNKGTTTKKTKNTRRKSENSMGKGGFGLVPMSRSDISAHVREFLPDFPPKLTAAVKVSSENHTVIVNSVTTSVPQAILPKVEPTAMEVSEKSLVPRATQSLPPPPAYDFKLMTVPEYSKSDVFRENLTANPEETPKVQNDADHEGRIKFANPAIENNLSVDEKPLKHTMRPIPDLLALTPKTISATSSNTQIPTAPVKESENIDDFVSELSILPILDSPIPDFMEIETKGLENLDKTDGEGDVKFIFSETISESQNLTEHLLDKVNSEADVEPSELCLENATMLTLPIIPSCKDEQQGNGHGAAGEDSGIDSMDALSEKSPNQGESPARKELDNSFTSTTTAESVPISMDSDSVQPLVQEQELANNDFYPKSPDKLHVLPPLPLLKSFPSAESPEIIQEPAHDDSGKPKPIETNSNHDTKIPEGNNTLENVNSPGQEEFVKPHQEDNVQQSVIVSPGIQNMEVVENLKVPIEPIETITIIDDPPPLGSEPDVEAIDHSDPDFNSDDRITNIPTPFLEDLDHFQEHESKENVDCRESPSDLPFSDRQNTEDKITEALLPEAEAAEVSGVGVKENGILESLVPDLESESRNNPEKEISVVEDNEISDKTVPEEIEAPVILAKTAVELPVEQTESTDSTNTAEFPEETKEQSSENLPIVTEDKFLAEGVNTQQNPTEPIEHLVEANVEEYCTKSEEFDHKQMEEEEVTPTPEIIEVEKISEVMEVDTMEETEVEVLPVPEQKSEIVVVAPSSPEIPDIEPENTETVEFPAQAGEILQSLTESEIEASVSPEIVDEPPEILDVLPEIVDAPPEAVAVPLEIVDVPPEGVDAPPEIVEILERDEQQPVTTTEDLMEVDQPDTVTTGQKVSAEIVKADATTDNYSISEAPTIEIDQLEQLEPEAQQCEQSLVETVEPSKVEISKPESEASDSIEVEAAESSEALEQEVQQLDEAKLPELIEVKVPTPAKPIETEVYSPIHVDVPNSIELELEADLKPFEHEVTKPEVEKCTPDVQPVEQAEVEVSILEVKPPTTKEETIATVPVPKLSAERPVPSITVDLPDVEIIHTTVVSPTSVITHIRAAPTSFVTFPRDVPLEPVCPKIPNLNISTVIAAETLVSIPPPVAVTNLKIPAPTSSLDSELPETKPLPVIRKRQRAKRQVAQKQVNLKVRSPEKVIKAPKVKEEVEEIEPNIQLRILEAPMISTPEPVAEIPVEKPMIEIPIPRPEFEEPAEVIPVIQIPEVMPVSAISVIEKPIEAVEPQPMAVKTVVNPTPVRIVDPQVNNPPPVIERGVPVSILPRFDQSPQKQPQRFFIQSSSGLLSPLPNLVRPTQPGQPSHNIIRPIPIPSLDLKPIMKVQPIASAPAPEESTAQVASASCSSSGIGVGRGKLGLEAIITALGVKSNPGETVQRSPIPIQANTVPLPVHHGNVLNVNRIPGIGNVIQVSTANLSSNLKHQNIISIPGAGGGMITIPANLSHHLQSQHHAQSGITVLPSGHKVVPIKLLTLPKGAGTPHNLPGVANQTIQSNRSSPTIIDLSNRVGSPHVFTTTRVASPRPIQTTPLNLSSVGGNITLVPISANHAQIQKVLGSSPVKGGNVLQMMMNANVKTVGPGGQVQAAHSQPTTIRVGRPGGGFVDLRREPTTGALTMSQQSLEQLQSEGALKPMPIKFPVPGQSGQTLGPVSVAPTPFRPSNDLVVQPVETSSTIAAEEKENETTEDEEELEDEEFGFEGDIIHDEQDVAVALASAQLHHKQVDEAVTQNGIDTHENSVTTNCVDSPLRPEFEETVERPSTFVTQNHSTDSGDIHGEDQEIIDSFSERVPSPEETCQASRPVTDHTYVGEQRNGKSKMGVTQAQTSMGELSIEIPVEDRGCSGIQAPRNTRSNTRIVSPDITALTTTRSETPKLLSTAVSKMTTRELRNSPRPSPTGGLKLSSPSGGYSPGLNAVLNCHLTGGSASPLPVSLLKGTAGKTNKRKRRGSDSSSASKDENGDDTQQRVDMDLHARPGKRRCSENAAELIKACIGAEDTPKRNTMLIKRLEDAKSREARTRKAAQILEESDDEVESLGFGRGRRSSRGSSEDRSSSRGSSVNRLPLPTRHQQKEDEKETKRPSRANHRNKNTGNKRGKANNISEPPLKSNHDLEENKTKGKPAPKSNVKNTKEPLVSTSGKGRTVNLKKEQLSSANHKSTTPTTSPETENPRRKTRSSAIAGGKDSDNPSGKRRRMTKD